MTKKLGDAILKTAQRLGINKTRQLIYGYSSTNKDNYNLNEIEAMRLFLSSRQQWVVDKFINEITEGL